VSLANHGVGACCAASGVCSVARNNIAATTNDAGKIELQHPGYAAAQHRRDVQPRAGGLVRRGPRHAKGESDHCGASHPEHSSGDREPDSAPANRRRDASAFARRRVGDGAAARGCARATPTARGRLLAGRRLKSIVHRASPLTPEVIRTRGRLVRLGGESGEVFWGSLGRRLAGARTERNQLFSGTEPVARQPHDLCPCLSLLLASFGLPAFPQPR
jgi:hypothetical protein